MSVTGSVIANDDDGHLVYEVGEVLQARYQIESLLGEGTFGKVLKVKDLLSSKFVALKMSKKVFLTHLLPYKCQGYPHTFVAG